MNGPLSQARVSSLAVPYFIVDEYTDKRSGIRHVYFRHGCFSQVGIGIRVEKVGVCCC